MENKLLEKYWDAETSIQEEQQLQQDMAGMSGPEAAYFAFLAEARKQKSQLDIDAIDAYNLKQAITSPNPVVMPLYRWLASAAAILVFVIAGFGLWKYSQQVSNPPAQMAETFDDPYEAYEEVREALAFVSAKLNKSQSEALINIKRAGEYADMFK